MRKILTLVLAALFMVVGGAAHAGGSDYPTPYDVRTDGIQLPEGRTFPAHGHVNVRYVAEGEGHERAASIHFDPNNNQPGGAWIGESFIPWDAFGITEGAQITWVQIHGYNEHYGEGGQKWTPVGPKPEPGHEVRETYEEGEWEAIDINCIDGEWTLERTNWTYAEYRESSIAWDRDAHWWSEVWGDWMLVESTDEIETKIETFDPAEEPACEAMPPTGAGQVVGLAGIALLTLIGGTFLVRRSKA